MCGTAFMLRKGTWKPALPPAPGSPFRHMETVVLEREPLRLF